MSFADLAARHAVAGPPAVPLWTLGCFHRRCITYATGLEDTSTRVIWVQSHGLTGDLRLPAVRPDVAHRGELAACTPAERAELARGEGFVARTHWRDGLMSWDAFASFQPYDKWPEPGRLERVGPCLVEWAPSGVYVEDWRLQAGSSGLCVGLSLVSETGPDGVPRPRAGGLLIAGDHALMLVDRRRPLPMGRAHEQLAARPDLWTDVFDASVAYARGGPRGWITKLAVDPFQVGKALFDEAAFSLAAEPGLLVQHGAGAWRERLWRIDTLLADQPREPATEAAEEGLAWLRREAAALGLPPEALA